MCKYYLDILLFCVVKHLPITQLKDPNFDLQLALGQCNFPCKFCVTSVIQASGSMNSIWVQMGGGGRMRCCWRGGGPLPAPPLLSPSLSPSASEGPAPVATDSSSCWLLSSWGRGKSDQIGAFPSVWGKIFVAQARIRLEALKWCSWLTFIRPPCSTSPKNFTLLGVN